MIRDQMPPLNSASTNNRFNKANFLPDAGDGGREAGAGQEEAGGEAEDSTEERARGGHPTGGTGYVPMCVWLTMTILHCTAPNL